MRSMRENQERILIEDVSVGPILVYASQVGIARLIFLPKQGVESVPYRTYSGHNTLLQRAASQLREYFFEGRKIFNLPLDLSGLSVFTREVLNLTCSIPWGEVASYGELASRLGNPKAARAVGGALARNPIPLIIPCHRVVASDGSLHGYSASGGIALKERLLQLEGLHVRSGVLN